MESVNLDFFERPHHRLENRGLKIACAQIRSVPRTCSDLAERDVRADDRVERAQILTRRAKARRFEIWDDRGTQENWLCIRAHDLMIQ